MGSVYKGVGWIIIKDRKRSWCERKGILKWGAIIKFRDDQEKYKMNQLNCG